MTRTWTSALSIVVAVSLEIGYAAGPPPLVEMNPEVLSQLQANFNRESSKTRIILLLSPT
jgi:hypothetical protein